MTDASDLVAVVRLCLPTPPHIAKQGWDKNLFKRMGLWAEHECPGMYSTFRRPGFPNRSPDLGIIGPGVVSSSCTSWF